MTVAEAAKALGIPAKQLEVDVERINPVLFKTREEWIEAHRDPTVRERLYQEWHEEYLESMEMPEEDPGPNI